MPRARSIACLALLAAVGCGPHVRKPNLFDPGNAATQQYNAILHDPFPATEVAPEIVGGRPREYARPVPEVVRGQAFRPQPTVAPPR
jgi:hypothetical protein